MRLENPNTPDVLFLNITPQLGGAERVLLACVDAALARNTEVHGAVVLTQGEGPCTQELRTRGVAVQCVPLPQRSGRLGSSSPFARLQAALWLPLLAPSLLLYLWRLRRHLKRSPANILHSHGLKAGLLTALAAPRGKQVVWHAHDFLSLRGSLTVALLRVAARKVTRVVAVSEAVAKDLAQVLPGVAVTTLPNAVSAPFLNPVQRSARSGPLRIGLLATFGYWKGHGLFLEAAAQLLKARPGAAQFLVVGSAVYDTGSEQADVGALRRQAKALGIAEAVEFLPFNPNVRGLYESLDVIVNASTKPEPFGMTLIEGMSRGCVAVAPDVGGPVEILDVGTAGLLYAANDATALAAALQRLVDAPELRQSLAAKGQARVQSLYAPQPYAQGLADLYSSL